MAQLKLGIATFIACTSIWAADGLPFAVKTGTWETTMQMSGMPAMPAIPPEALARMPPEQRARMEESLKTMQGKPTTTRSCITEEQLKKAFDMGSQPNCTRTILSSSSTSQEIKLECSSERSKSSGVIKIEAVGKELVKGTMHMTSTSAGSPREMTMNSTFTSKWIGSECEKK